MLPTPTDHTGSKTGAKEGVMDCLHGLIGKGYIVQTTQRIEFLVGIEFVEVLCC